VNPGAACPRLPTGAPRRPGGPAAPLGAARAFSLVELLVVLASIGVLVSLLAPSLAGARRGAHAAVCLSNLRQLALGWTLYAADHADRAMPLAYWSAEDVGPGGEQLFWWGSHGSSVRPVDHARGFLSPYLAAGLHERSVYECPAQPWGTYRPQGPSKQITSTYGYNGYYLSPARTPGWGAAIGHRPWRRLHEIARPVELAVFADALLPGGRGALPSNTALLDPPMLFEAPGRWRENPSPTSAFRHGGGARRRACAVAAADAHAAAHPAEPGWLTHPEQGIGSIGGRNDPTYVPDWEDW